MSSEDNPSSVTEMIPDTRREFLIAAGTLVGGTTAVSARSSVPNPTETEVPKGEMWTQENFDKRTKTSGFFFTETSTVRFTTSVNQALQENKESDESLPYKIQSFFEASASMEGSWIADVDEQEQLKGIFKGEMQRLHTSEEPSEKYGPHTLLANEGDRVTSVKFEGKAKDLGPTYDALDFEGWLVHWPVTSGRRAVGGVFPSEDSYGPAGADSTPSFSPSEYRDLLKKEIRTVLPK